MGHKDAKEGTNGATENTTGFDINTDENMSGSSHLNEPLTEESVTDRLKEELQESKDKYLRLAAEFDNFKRRSAKERVELVQTAGRDLITDLLEVVDDIERAEKQFDSTEDLNHVKDGLTLVFNKFRNKLQSKGLKPMEAIGKDFNADLHEAITEIPAPSEELKGKIVDEITKGYYLNEKIIRHAKVVVGK
ncbi:MAG: nucleotide exchange factor GrpE [Chitinophagaceae bacterium]|nr:MAG: nucleotide exchange factor GrpE [Chitinophagaceae bacterium]